jgi:hypothetical protein
MRSRAVGIDKRQNGSQFQGLLILVSTFSEVFRFRTFGVDPPPPARGLGRLSACRPRVVLVLQIGSWVRGTNEDVTFLLSLQSLIDLLSFRFRVYP